MGRKKGSYTLFNKETLVKLMLVFHEEDGLTFSEVLDRYRRVSEIFKNLKSPNPALTPTAVKTTSSVSSVNKTWLSKVLKHLIKRGLIKKENGRYYSVADESEWDAFIEFYFRLKKDLPLKELRKELKSIEQTPKVEGVEVQLLSKNPVLQYGRAKGMRLKDVINYYFPPIPRVSLNCIKNYIKIVPDHTPGDAIEVPRYDRDELRRIAEDLIEGRLCMDCFQKYNELWRIEKRYITTAERTYCTNPNH